MLNSSFVTVELGVGFGVVGEMVEFGATGDAVLPGKLPLHEAKELRMTNSDKIETFFRTFHRYYSFLAKPYDTPSKHIQSNKILK